MSRELVAKIGFVMILALAVFVRFFNLPSNPPSLNWDEVSIGYNAYSILQSGQDEWGDKFPLNFRSYGDYKLPGFIYLDVPFVALFGLNEWGVRLPSALLGIGSVVLIFLILKEMTGKMTVSIVGMFVASILPWSIILSRIALEANLALFLTNLAIYFFLKSFRSKNYLILAASFLGLTLFSYNSSRVIILPLVLAVIILFFNKFRQEKSQALVGLSVLLVFIAITLPLAFLQDSSARYRWTTLLDQGAINQINDLRGSSALPPLLSRLTYNKESYFLIASSRNYLSHFSPNFLFASGGSNFQYSVPGSGLIYWLLLPFLIMGIFKAIVIRNAKWYFILVLLLISPLPGAVTRDAPHALRSLLMISPIVILVSLGVEVMLSFLRSSQIRYTLICVLAVILLFEFGLFWKNYTLTYPINYSWSWQYGYKMAVEYARANYQNYSSIIFSKIYGEPHEFVLFYTKYDPQKYRDSPYLIRYKRSDWYWVDQFDKFKFVNDWEIKQKTASEHNALLMTSPGNYPVRAEKMGEIYFLDGKVAFEIVKLP